MCATPDEMAAALVPVVRGQLGDWGRSSLMVVGYSRGADLAAFVVNRWPEDLKARVRGIGFVGLSERASFEFHYADLALDIARATDLPTRPEVEKLIGTPMWCVRGADEGDSFGPRHVNPRRQCRKYRVGTVGGDVDASDVEVAEARCHRDRGRDACGRLRRLPSSYA